ncbi:unnamed protein product [Allacma fusca]|uniref:Uncharacterized protein n=1 Tax=Allacma fusca TaxID=39272 RepID=A0A8J2J7T7_9HEXA|nr:unnamed protein product [Allacma fusca]
MAGATQEYPTWGVTYSSDSSPDESASEDDDALEEMDDQPDDMVLLAARTHFIHPIIYAYYSELKCV